jgi:hypothetical protein
VIIADQNIYTSVHTLQHLRSGIARCQLGSHRSLTSMRLAVSTGGDSGCVCAKALREPLPPSPSPRPHPYRPSEGEGGRGEAPFVEPELRLAVRDNGLQVWRDAVGERRGLARRSSIYSGSLSQRRASPVSFIQRTSPFNLSGLGCHPRTEPATVKESGSFQCVTSKASLPCSPPPISRIGRLAL